MLQERVMEALRPVMDPELRRSIVELGMVRSVTGDEDGRVTVTISLTTPGCPIRSQFETAVTAAVGALEGVTSVEVRFDVLSPQEKQSLSERLGRPSLPEGALAEIGTILCVASGKGGVGKSSLTANLAAALAAAGHRVGTLDADVWGYSLPRMLGVRRRPEISATRKIVPVATPEGIRTMSIGFFLDEDQEVVWRGPMLHKVLQQFLEDVEWGPLDHLVVDLPPGTGDVSMSLAQFLPQARFVIVTTPQTAAQRVARRAAKMAVKLEHEVVGVIENMSVYVDGDGKEHHIFGTGGGRELADELDVPLLGQIPLTVALREDADAGRPVVLARPDDPASVAITATARRLAALSPQKPRPLPMASVGVGIPLPMAG